MSQKGNLGAAIDATVTPKGQITLPRAVRSRLGSQTGSRTLPGGGVEAHPVLLELEDLRAMADQGGERGSVMTFDEMKAAKVRNAMRNSPNPRKSGC